MLELMLIFRESISFDSFTLIKFSKAELDHIFHNNFNEIIFPWAVVNTDMVKDYFIISTNHDSLSKYNFEIGYDERQINSIKNSLDYNLPLHGHLIIPILRMMVLYDWRQSEAYFNEFQGLDRKDFYPDSFSIPFFYMTEDSFLVTPKNNLYNTNHYELKNIEPIKSLQLDENETNSFVEFLHKIDRYYLNLKNFDIEEIFVFEKAMDYYVKAFLSQGLESILWYIACIEALLGDKGDKEKGIIKGITDRLIGILSPATKKEKKKITDSFGELYEFRSKMVHGKLFRSKEVHGKLKEHISEAKHFHNAREFAKIGIVWYLNFLNQITQHKYDREKIKKIKINELVYLIDFFVSTRGKFNFFLHDLPQEFPYIESWIK